MIRPASASDSPAIAEIYNYYIANTIITFEEILIDAEEMQQRIESTQAKHCWLVYEQDDELLGYAYSGPWRPRSAYRYAVESTVYLDPDSGGRGIGTALYQALIKQAEQQNYHTVIGAIALPNAASIALHEKLGFKKIAHLKDVGFKFDRRIDVGYWQLML